MIEAIGTKMTITQGSKLRAKGKDQL